MNFLMNKIKNMVDFYLLKGYYFFIFFIINTKFILFEKDSLIKKYIFKLCQNNYILKFSIEELRLLLSETIEILYFKYDQNWITMHIKSFEKQKKKKNC